MSHLKPLVPYLLGHKPALLFGLLATVISTMLALAQPYFIGAAIDALQHGRPASDVYLIAVEILAFAALQGVFTFFVRYLINSVSRRVEYAMRRDLFAHLERMPQSFFQDNHTGDIMARATNDLSAVRDMLGPGILQLGQYDADVRDRGRADVRHRHASGDHRGRLPAAGQRRLHADRAPGCTSAMSSVQAQFGELSTRAQENFSGIRVVKAYAQEDQRDRRLRPGRARVRAAQHGLPAALRPAVADDGPRAGRDRGAGAVRGRRTM